MSGSGYEEPEVPPSGAIFTFGKSKFAENAPSKFWIKRDLIVAISCGDEHTAVVTQTGRLFTFGSNEFGQLGLGHNENVLKPSCVKVLKPDKVLAVACGKTHTVVGMISGRLWAFGNNAEGQLGIGREHETVNKPFEVQIDLEDPMIAIASGSSHTLALGQSGTVYVWGSNKEGQLGLGAEGEESLFVPTPLLAFIASVGPVKAISCGYYHSALVTMPFSDQRDVTEPEPSGGNPGGGSLYTFGEADGGKLGLGKNVTSEADVPTRVDIPDESIVDVSCGGDHTLALTSNGEVFSFGTSSNGQLGLGTRILETPQPQKIKGGGSHRIVRISCGENHTALVTEDGKLLTFGDGRHGKLCLDVETLTNHYTPVPSTRFRGFHVENAVCGGCHTMVQARPIPGYLPEPDADDFGTLANGHEEINLEARRRHRQEKLPPLSPNAEAEAAAAAASEANPDQEDQEDAEKILTIEQADETGEAETEGDEAGQKPTRGQKISSFFKNLGRKKENTEASDNKENTNSPTKKKVRFFGKNKKEDEEEEENGTEAEADEAKKDSDENKDDSDAAAEDRLKNGEKETDAESVASAASDAASDNQEEADENSKNKKKKLLKKEDALDEDENEDKSESDEDSVSSIEDNSPNKPETDVPAKEKKKVTIQEDEDGKPVVESDQEAQNDKAKKKKSKACTIL